VGTLQHLGMERAEVKLAWHDLAKDLHAVAFPGTADCCGVARRLIALNTVYYVALPCADAYLLAAYLNSLPVRVFARAIAERAKDAHFRFFAGTVGALPLPAAWRARSPAALLEISRAAHQRGTITPTEQHQLDELISDRYGLGPAARLALRRFDAWLKGEEP
jgi:hypothetical protein